jgi:hypothetical protein
MAPVHRDPVKLPRELLRGLREDLSTPGPGRYSLSPRSSRSVHFSRSPRPRTLFPGVPESTPGCIYSQEVSSTSRRVVAGRFSRSPRKMDRPIPGGSESQLSPLSTLSKRSFSFGASRSAYQSVYFPGSDREKIGRTSLTISSSRVSLSSQRSGRSFSRSPRSPSSVRSPERQLGPGSYDPSVPKARIGYAVPFPGARKKFSNRFDFPDFDKLSKLYWSMYPFWSLF